MAGFISSRTESSLASYSFDTASTPGTQCYSFDTASTPGTQLDEGRNSDIFCITPEIFEQFASSFYWGGDSKTTRSIHDDEDREATQGEDDEQALIDRESQVVSSLRNSDGSSAATGSRQRRNESSVVLNPRRQSMEAGNSNYALAVTHSKRPTTVKMSKSKSSRKMKKKIHKRPSFGLRSSKKEMDILPEASDECLSSTVIKEVTNGAVLAIQFLSQNMDQDLKAEIKHAIKSTKISAIDSNVHWEEVTESLTQNMDEDLKAELKHAIESAKKSAQDVQDLFLDPNFHADMKEQAGYLMGIAMGSGRSKVVKFAK